MSPHPKPKRIHPIRDIILRTCTKLQGVCVPPVKFNTPEKECNWLSVKFNIHKIYCFLALAEKCDDNKGNPSEVQVITEFYPLGCQNSNRYSTRLDLLSQNARPGNMKTLPGNYSLVKPIQYLFIFLPKHHSRKTKTIIVNHESITFRCTYSLVSKISLNRTRIIIVQRTQINRWTLNQYYRQYN